MATTWDAWDDDLLSDLPGCTPAYLHHQLVLAAIDFFDRSWAWIFQQTSIPVVAGTPSYAWTPPANTGVTHALHAWLGNSVLTPKTRNELTALYGAYLKKTGASAYFIRDVPSKITLIPNPTSDAANPDGITGTLALVPLLSAPSMDAELADYYFDEIGMGAKARLLVQPRKPWTDVARGAAMREEFEQAAARAKVNVIKSYSSARTRVRAQFF